MAVIQILNDTSDDVTPYDWNGEELSNAEVSLNVFIVVSVKCALIGV